MGCGGGIARRRGHLGGVRRSCRRCPDADVLAVSRKHCMRCHAHAPSHPSFDAPPKQVVLESIEELKAWAPKILEQVVWDRNMPIGNDTGMTEEERALLERWIETLK